MKTFYKLFILLLGLTSIGNLKAQTNFSLTVLDEQQKPIEYATIELRKADVKTLFKAAITNNKGASDLQVTDGKFTATIVSVGFATKSVDFTFPATANVLADKVGAKNAWGYDLIAACSGFIYALTTGAKFIESGHHKKVLVIGVDKMSSILDYEDRTTCVIFGDGAGAVLLEPNEEGNGVLDFILRSDGSGKQYLQQPAARVSIGTS